MDEKAEDLHSPCDDVHATIATWMTGEDHVWVLSSEPGFAVLRAHTTGYGKGTLSRGEPIGGLKTRSSSPTPNPAERLQLSLYEAFYLTFGQGRHETRRTCRVALYFSSENTRELQASADAVWRAFCDAWTEFPYFYAAYDKFRREGWAPHPGLKYGADFVLYKVRKVPHGHPDASAKQKHEHSPFCVVLGGKWKHLGTKLAGARAWPSRESKLRIVRQVRKKLWTCLVAAPMTKDGRELRHDQLVQGPGPAKRMRISLMGMHRWAFPNV